jgi:hypothetical protein
MRWRIYYADGNAFGSDQGMWDGAPSDGVLFVAVDYGDGRIERHSGSDFYAMLEDTVASTQDISPILRQKAPWLKFGVWTSHGNLERARQRMMAEFP